MRRLEITPLDVVLFRDARPFGYAAASGLASGLFPPAPSTLLGALRTAAYRAHGVRLSSAGPPHFPDEAVRTTWGDAEGLGDVRICGCALRYNKETLWPCPANLAVSKERASKNTGVAVALPIERPMWDSSSMRAGLRPLWITAFGVFTSAGGWLRTADLQRYLRGESIDDVAPVPENAELPRRAGGGRPIDQRLEGLVIREDREGIALEDSRRTTRDGALFQMGFRRLLPGVSFSVWIEGDSRHALPSRGVLRLGQDGKLAEYRGYSADSADWPDAPSEPGVRFFVYLASPARFDQGWIPSWIDPNSLRIRERPWKGTLVSVALEGSQMFGGWSLVPQGPRALQRTVRAGSVYFFEADTPGDAAAAANALHASRISEPSAQSPAQMHPDSGWGLCFSGVW